jgi:hypothetical protein
MRLLVLALLTAAFAQAQLKIAVYATAGDVSNLLGSAEARERLAPTLRRLGISNVIVEGRRGDEYVVPTKLAEVRDHLTRLGFTTLGGIATVPGLSWGTRQQGPLAWLNWESAKTQADVAEFFRTNPAVFEQLVIDDFFCTGDTSPASEQARAGRDWGEYRRNLMVSLVPRMVRQPAGKAHLIVKFPQWYDLFHRYGYDTARLPGLFDEVWAGTEVRNPATRRMGYVQPTEGYMNFRWIQSQVGDKLTTAWFDHIECTAQNFVDQAYLSVLAGARQLVLFNLGDVAAGHAGHALFERALPELGKAHDAVRGRRPLGVAYYKPPNSEGQGDLYLPDYLAMLGLPVTPVATYPENFQAVILGRQAAADPQLAAKVAAHLKRGARILATPALRLPGVTVLELGTFTDADFLAAGEWLLAPKEIAWLDMPQEKADGIRRSLGLDFSAPTRIAWLSLEGRDVLYSFRDEAAEVKLRGQTIAVPAHGLVLR